MKIRNILRNQYALLCSIGRTKVFCVGFNKTGTTSLLYALKEHGYRFGNFGQGERLISAFELNNFSKIINYCRYGTAFKDVPLSLPKVFKYLNEYFEDSKFILTVRDDSEQWYMSITEFHKKTFAKGKRIPTYEDLINCEYCYKGWAWEYMNNCFNTLKEDPYNKELLIKEYERHIYDVKEYFKDSPEKLLIINVSDSDSYHKMCGFLDVKPIFEIFPWKNKTKNKIIL